MTQEFHISVTPVGENEYLVRTEKVASGVPLAEEQVKWPVDEWLKQTRQLMNDPLLGVLEGQTLSRFRHPSEKNQIRTLTDPPVLSLVELGQQLYQGLFQGTLRDSWTCAQAIAQNRDELLQIRLGVKGKRLSSLPWEVLHAADRPLATGTYIGFSRYQPGTTPILYNQVRHPNQPLKILMAIAAPTDQDSLQLKQEVLHIQEELRRDHGRHSLTSGEPSSRNVDIQLTILEQPDREQLTQALEQGQYQIFHYAGHSNLGLSGGELYLVSNKTGLTETLSGDDLAGLLVNNGVQMVVLNSCRGAYGNTTVLTEDTAQVNLAEALVKRGIPGVLAMAERIPDDVALTFTRLFYRNIINQDDPIDIILNRVRQGLITSYSSEQLYWALPVLYLHREFDGYLTPASAAPAVAREQESQAASVQRVQTQLIPKSPPTPALPDWNLMNDDEVEDFLDDLIYEDDLNDDGNGTDFIGNALRELNQSKSVPPAETIPGQEKPQSPSELPTSSPPVSAEPKPLVPARLTSAIPGQFRQWLGILSAVILVHLGLGIWLFQSRVEKNVESTPTPNVVQVTENQPITLDKANTESILGIALDQFQQRNLLVAAEATTELLNRGALQQAKAALATVPIQDRDQAVVNFLNGRLIWQSIQAGSIEYKIDDGRRYWEKAVKQDPQSVEYKNALAFAYYTEGKLENAYQLWSQVLEQEEPTFVGKPQKETSQIQTSEVNLNKNDELTAYAGLGLVWRKFAQTLPPEKKEFMLSKAVKFSEKVRSENPTAFQPDQLSKNWMWSKELIQDWQLLLQISNQ